MRKSWLCIFNPAIAVLALQKKKVHERFKMDQAERLEDNALLTPRQSTCMRLVEKGWTSKQIARELGISSRTVDQHIGAVIDILQVNNRMAAVTRLREMAGEHAQRKSPRSNGPIINSSASDNDVNAEGLRPVFHPERSAPAGAKLLFPPLGGRPNAALKAQRLAWFFRIALIAVMASCFIILTNMGLSRIA